MGKESFREIKISEGETTVTFLEVDDKLLEGLRGYIDKIVTVEWQNERVSQEAFGDWDTESCDEWFLTAQGVLKEVSQREVPIDVKEGTRSLVIFGQKRPPIEISQGEKTIPFYQSEEQRLCFETTRILRISAEDKTLFEVEEKVLS